MTAAISILGTFRVWSRDETKNTPCVGKLWLLYPLREDKIGRTFTNEDKYTKDKMTMRTKTSRT